MRDTEHKERLPSNNCVLLTNCELIEPSSSRRQPEASPPRAFDAVSSKNCLAFPRSKHLPGVDRSHCSFYIHELCGSAASNYSRREKYVPEHTWYRCYLRVSDPNAHTTPRRTTSTSTRVLLFVRTFFETIPCAAPRDVRGGIRCFASASLSRAVHLS